MIRESNRPRGFAAGAALVLKSHRLLLFALLAAPLGAGCDVYDESLLTDPSASAIPARPDAGLDGPDIDPLTIALREPVLEQTENQRWRQIGFDLDELQTSSEDSEVECLPEGRKVPLDGDDGIDNVVGADLLPLVTLSESVKNLAEDARDSQERGQGTLVVHISEYNGTAYDPQVRVVVAQAVAGTPLPSSEVAFVEGELIELASGEPAAPPAWDGSDHWYVRDDAFFLGVFERPRISDEVAYVSGGKLVVRLPDRASILFFAGQATVTVRMAQGLVVGTLEDDLRGLRDVNIGGRMSILDVLETGESAGVCLGTPERTIFEGQLPSMADVLSVPGTSGGPSVTCDALSVGVLFESGVVGIGVPVPVESPPIANPCETP